MVFVDPSNRSEEFQNGESFKDHPKIVEDHPKIDKDDEHYQKAITGGSLILRGYSRGNFRRWDCNVLLIT